MHDHYLIQYLIIINRTSLNKYQWHLIKIPISSYTKIRVIIHSQMLSAPLFVWHGGCCNIKYPSETHPKLESREISFEHILLLNRAIVLKFCTEHGSITAVVCANFHNDLTTEMDVLDERDFARFEYIRWISDGYPELQQSRDSKKLTSKSVRAYPTGTESDSYFIKLTL